MFYNWTKSTLVLSIAIALSGCGGGSSSEPAADNTKATTSNTNNTNSSPVMAAASYTLLEDTPFTANLSATDADNDALTFSLLSAPESGALTLASDGSFTYLSNLNFHGSDRFSAQVSDGKTTTNAEFTLVVSSENDKPVVTDVETYTRAGQAITFAIPATDADDDKLTIEVATQPKKGSLVVNQDNTLTYTPEQNAQGVDQITLNTSDGIATVTSQLVVDNNLSIKGSINLSQADLADTQVLLTSDDTLQYITPKADGSFSIYGLETGDYRVKVRKSGFKATPAQAVSLDLSAQLPSQSEQAAPKIAPLLFELEQLDSSYFSYHWQEDQSTAGSDYSAAINQPVEVEFLQQSVTVVDDSSADQLQHDYNILLADGEGFSNWSQEHAYRLLATMKTIPQQKRDFYKSQTLAASKWNLTSDFIEDDIAIVEVDGAKQVTISTAAFTNATPKLAKVEGKRGIFYSQRLHHALVRFVTNNGSDKPAYEKILTERYGVTTDIADYMSLTQDTTGSEPNSRFQEFQAEEIVQIINMFEEMPKGMHALPELKYLVRRVNGQTHPLYPSAPAVAWPENGYIEFMESAFNSVSVEHMHRLIIHEKAHFLWHNQFAQELKNDWIEVGGWYQDENSASGWSTTKQTEFVSAYAHAVNPNEDMAESVSYFVINPDKLRSRAPDKYNFIRDRVMQGNIYLAKIRDDVTFQVYNLYPDYVFPGKIKRVDIAVNGQAEQDKTVSVEIELHALDAELEGAKRAYLRIFSEIGTYVDLYLEPKEAELSTVLTGSFELSKYAKSGHWRTDQIVITDAVGNERMEGANDFGWKLYVNNSLEDVTAPEYVNNSLTLSKSVTQIEGQEVQVLHANWQVTEAVAMADSGACYATLNDEIASTYSYQTEGSYDSQSQTCKTEILMPHYMPSSVYSVSQANMKDKALNERGVYFTDPGHALRDEETIVDELSPEVVLSTNNPDTQHPELDLNDIQISAQPSNPETPNGETKVQISFKVKDNISGYNLASLSLRDPQGIVHNYWAYNDSSWSLFPEGEQGQWQTYTRTIVLPAGSAPGTWGLTEMTIYDRANNFKSYDFTEIVHFDVTE